MPRYRRRRSGRLSVVFLGAVRRCESPHQLGFVCAALIAAFISFCDAHACHFPNGAHVVHGIVCNLNGCRLCSGSRTTGDEAGAGESVLSVPCPDRTH
jgi:hypothetical protein